MLDIQNIMDENRKHHRVDDKPRTDQFDMSQNDELESMLFIVSRVGNELEHPEGALHQ